MTTMNTQTLAFKSFIDKCNSMTAKTRMAGSQREVNSSVKQLQQEVRRFKQKLEASPVRFERTAA